jgi:hypothetical protein
MSSTHEIEYKGHAIRIVVAADGQGRHIGTFTVLNTDPPLQGNAADESSAEEALSTAERKVKELIDQQR